MLMIIFLLLSSNTGTKLFAASVLPSFEDEALFFFSSLIVYGFILISTFKDLVSLL